MLTRLIEIEWKDHKVSDQFLNVVATAFGALFGIRPLDTVEKF